MSNEKIKPPYAANKSFSPKLVWVNNSKIRLRFTGSCLKQDKATFIPNNAVNLYIVYELDRWSQDLNVKFTLKDCLFGNVTDPNKYSYSRYVIGFDSRSIFSIPNFDWGKNIIIFGVDMNLFVHDNNKNKDTLILGKGQTQGWASRIFYSFFKITKKILLKSSLSWKQQLFIC